MMVELAIGDAYGAAFEYVKPEIVCRHNDLARYYRHPRHGIEAGCYTDDTQMSIAIAEILIEGVEWTPKNLAGRFLDAFNRDRREGYASGFYAFLCSAVDTEDFLDRIRPDSEKSGAAMRSCPLGCIRSIEELKEKAEVQAAITHNTKVGIESSIAAALSAHYFYHGLGPKDGLGDFLCGHVVLPGNEEWKKPVGAHGLDAVRASVSVLLRHKSLSEVLKACVSYGGDVDTVACLALGVGSCCPEIENDLPDILKTGLENGKYGRDFLMRLDCALNEKFLK